MAKIKSMLKSAIRLLKEEKKVAVPVPINAAALLEGKVALITGGSGGIGFAMAQSFIKSGCKVVIAGTSESKLKACCEEIGENIASLVIDVTDVKALPEKVQMAAGMFPENRLDILVNSAGVVNRTDFLCISEQEYDRVMDINAKGTFFMSQAMAQYMIKNQIKGHILNVSSSSALRPAWTPYQMSKWAVRGFTLGLSDTLLPYGIVVNAIAPGPVATPMLGKRKGDNIYHETSPSGRYALPEEIAALATFMVSDMGKLIVGDTFYMTGGSGTISCHR